MATLLYDLEAWHAAWLKTEKFMVPPDAGSVRHGFQSLADIDRFYATDEVKDPR
jgi:hypothetical protein